MVNCSGGVVRISLTTRLDDSSFEDALVEFESSLVCNGEVLCLRKPLPKRV